MHVNTVNKWLAKVNLLEHELKELEYYTEKDIPTIPAKIDIVRDALEGVKEELRRHGRGEG